LAFSKAHLKIDILTKSCLGIDYSSSLSFLLLSFAVLCKVCEPSLASDNSSVDLHSVEALEEVTTSIAHFLLSFFVEEGQNGQTVVMRPLTNSNFVLDFYRYEAAPYHATMMQYLQQRGNAPDYDRQYREVLRYFRETKYLHKYGKFTLSGAMSSTPNTKSLQPVSGTDGAARKLARSDYYKYKAATLMFGFNSGIMHGLESFCEFNSLRKNQLLRFYKSLLPGVGGCAQALTSKAATKYRDYCEYARRRFMTRLF
jgi:hypothetical protein